MSMCISSNNQAGNPIMKALSGNPAQAQPENPNQYGAANLVKNANPETLKAFTDSFNNATLYKSSQKPKAK
jgi:hypothetical protein